MCSCSKGKTTTADKGWEHVSPTGKATSYSRESDARMAVAREGGTAKPKK